MGLRDKLWNKIFHFYYNKSGKKVEIFVSEIVTKPHLIRKFEIDSFSVREMIKMTSSYKYFGTPPAPPTPPVFRAVLPHKEAIVQRILHPSVYKDTLDWILFYTKISIMMSWIPLKEFFGRWCRSKMFWSLKIHIEFACKSPVCFLVWKRNNVDIEGTSLKVLAFFNSF